MSFTLLRRVWQRIRNPSQCVGRDLEGNKYFEYADPNGAPRTKRIVKYRQGYDMWTYVADEKRLPVQWTSWLTHTRSAPPTLEELHQDLARQERVRLRAALLESSYTSRITASPDLHNSVSLQNDRDLAVRTDSDSVAHSEPVSDQSRRLPLVSATVANSQGQSERPPPNDETQTWVPRSRRRNP